MVVASTREREIVRKVALRTIPLLGLMYVVSFLDRVNIGFAALTMNKAIGISPVAYGSAAGVFFAGYLLFQLPANLLMARLGARRWMALIMLVWGFVAAGMAAVGNDRELILARFLLGVAEAGFFPGAILYMTMWYPPAQRGRLISLFMFAAPIAYVIGGPVSGYILETMNGWHKLAGWQWLFIVEALPAIILAPLVLKYLPDKPQDASWLSGPERSWLMVELGRGQPAAGGPVLVWSWAMAACALAYFGLQVGVYGIGLWLPQIISGDGRSALVTGILGAIPYLCAIAGMLYWGRRADRGGVGALHVWLPTICAGIFLMLSANAPSFALRLCGLTGMTVCLFAALPLFWAYATSNHKSIRGPLAIAIVNSAGSVGAFAGPIGVGWIRAQTASFLPGLFSIGIVLVTSGLVIMLLGKKSTPDDSIIAPQQG